MRTSKILVIGAGGLGCEILKNLALSGFTDIHVIDLDTIDISNLNRQFLFRHADIGRPKAIVAAEFISQRVAGCIVTAYHGKIQDHSADFYAQFKIIISGLDNIEARRWLNCLLVGMVQTDESGDIDPSTIIPLIDGGTEGLKGQSRVIIPKITSCFECSIESFPPVKSFPICTIAETPRLPEHCISYAFLLEWEKHFPNKKLDTDSADDMMWVYNKALERAQFYGIEGVTYFKTIGVVKNVIPAVASTNAIIAASCVNEAMKLLYYCSQTMNTYMMYMGGDGVYAHTFEYAKKPDCIVCSDSSDPVTIQISQHATLKEFLDNLTTEPTYQLKKPSAVAEKSSLYMTNPPSLERQLRGNLEKSMGSLVHDSEVITITDSALLQGIHLHIKVKFTDDAITDA